MTIAMSAETIAEPTTELRTRLGFKPQANS